MDSVSRLATKLVQVEIDFREGGSRCEMIDCGLIVSNPKVMLGKPVIRGTRITVELILEKFAVGQTEANILRAYPHLTQEGVRAALAFAAKEARLP